MIEHDINMKLSSYFEQSDLTDMVQFGFKNNLSTIKVVDSVVTEIMNGQIPFFTGTKCHFR